MAAIPSVSSNANPQRQTQVNKPETSNETAKPSESKNSVSVPKGGSKRNEQKSHHPPILPGVLPDGRSHDPNLFFAGNGFAPQYFFDYSGAGFAGQPALSHLPWEEYNRLMTMNGPDGQPIFNGELGPVFFQAPPEFVFPNQPHFPFGGAPSMGADGQLYGPHAFHAFGHVFPPGQFIPQANGNEPSGIGENKNNPSQSSDKSHSHTNGNHTNPSSSIPAQLRGTSPGTVENSVKQAPNDSKTDPKAKTLTQTQTFTPNRLLRDHARPLETNHPLPFPRVLPPQNGFGRAGGRGQAISSNGFFDARTAGRGWAPAIDTRGKGRGRGMNYLNGDGMHDIANEQNRGPRTVRSKSQQSVNGSTTDPSKQTRLPETLLQGDYNSPNFPTTYNSAKFFVIKSYSEDDVHKSIKYSVWASTPNGNKRLDAAFKEATQVKDGCPVFLFFSVNASGQFCGVAEMSSAVDFSKSVEYWQQDKWNGQFKVKWHIIKDVPNGQFRHILLANNENKPVTNSRDTQEVKLEQGLEMLNIFKKFSAKTSILDDFTFYDNRQKAMQEKRAKLTLQLKQKPQVPLKQMVSALQIHGDRKDFNSSAGQLLKDITKEERVAVLPKTNGHVENEPTSHASSAQANGSAEPSEKILTPSQSVNSKPPGSVESSRLLGAKSSEFKLPESTETELSKSLSNSLTINSKGLDTGA